MSVVDKQACTREDAVHRSVAQPDAKRPPDREMPLGGRECSIDHKSSPGRLPSMKDALSRQRRLPNQYFEMGQRLRLHFFLDIPRQTVLVY